ncbi:MAG: esterase family protein [Gammaproteobacteria bacterium]|nr:MAG: esterase family protein [Gammaproteobacteria bacterium]
MKKYTGALLFSCLISCMSWAQEDTSKTRNLGDYPFTKDSLEQANVPKGKLEGPFEFHSKIFAGTVRQYWIYVPAVYKPKAKTKPALLVFQDGQRATNPNGSLRVPQALDNLIYQKAIPQTLGVFITPGNLSERYPDNLGMSNPDHRAPEYDSLSDDYSRFLVDELLPEIAKKYSYSSNPDDHIIGGTSSGAICAFTVAWHRPDQFRKVISMIGSYTSIGYQPATDDKPLVPGGDLYPGLIRKSPIRPLRIFLQDGSNDLNNEHGNWFLANQQMLSSLEWANSNADKANDKGTRYDINHVWGDGAHSDQHGGSLLPEILRWMWRDSEKK